MAIRHHTRVNQDLNSSFGVFHLDGQGIVTNLEELGCTEEQVLAHTPGMLDCQYYPPKAAVEATTEPDPKEPQEVPEEGTNGDLTEGEDPTGEGENQREEDGPEANPDAPASGEGDGGETKDPLIPVAEPAAEGTDEVAGESEQPTLS